MDDNFGNNFNLWAEQSLRNNESSSFYIGVELIISRNKETVTYYGIYSLK